MPDGRRSLSDLAPVEMAILDLVPSYTPAFVSEGSGLTQFGAWICAPGTDYGPYSSSLRQLIWIIDGSALVRAGDVTFHAGPDTVFSTPRDVEYHITWDPRRPTRLGYASFGLDSVGEIPLLRRLEGDDVVISLLNHIVWLSTEQPPDWIPSARQAFDYALRAYISGHSRSRIGLDDVYSELLARATAAMQRRWRSTMPRLSLGELADELGVSSRHLSRVFARELGVGPVTTFRILRVLEAARLLTDTTVAIREIATRVGFANEFHFSRVFKDTVGVPPAEYRAQPPAVTAIPPQIAHLHRTQAGHFLIPD